MFLSTTKNDFKPMSLMSLFLSFLSLAIVSYLMFSHSNSSEYQLLKTIDTCICFLFMLQILVDYIRAPDKKFYLKTHWIDIIASIPIIEAFRFARIFQVLRIVMVLRASHRLLDSYLTNRKEATIATILTLIIFLLTIGSSMILIFEAPAPNSNIKTASDAIWWIFVTISTVGYGDHYPVTMAGKAIAILIIISGVGIFGMVSGLVASIITNPKKKQAEIVTLKSNQNIGAISDHVTQTKQMNLILKQQQQIIEKIDRLEQKISKL